MAIFGALSGVSNPLSAGSNPLGGLVGEAPPTYTNLTYFGLQQKYGDFAFPMAEISLGGKTFTSRGEDMVVNDIHVELSAGFEASACSFRVYNVYDGDSGRFRFDEVKSQILLGNAITVKLGYLGVLETVFVGFVAGVAFGYEPDSLPYIEVAGMDLKALMMGGAYARQCTAKTYSGAVSEILQRTGYEKLRAAGGVVAVEVESTPDKQPEAGRPDAASAYTVELVSESDYEFVCKAAKKFNFDFFVDRGKVIFRKAKGDDSILMTLNSGAGLESFRVEYSLTGIVGAVEARAMNPGEGKVIKAKGAYPAPGDALSTGSKAKSLVGGGTKVYIDPTIGSQSQAEARVASLREKMSYRLGTLEGGCVGIPELVPGRFVRLQGLGVPADNKFYLAEVAHEFTSDVGFRTRLTGRANSVETGMGGPTGGVP